MSATPAPVPCSKCKAPTDRLDLFPGDVCLACWAAVERPMPTAAEIVAMWGGGRK